MSKCILDACCGSRMFWFDKKDPRAVFMDNRRYIGVACDGRTISVDPDVIGDFRAPSEMTLQAQIKELTIDYENRLQEYKAYTAKAVKRVDELVKQIADAKQWLQNGLDIRIKFQHHKIEYYNLLRNDVFEAHKILSNLVHKTIKLKKMKKNELEKVVSTWSLDHLNLRCCENCKSYDDWTGKCSVFNCATNDRDCCSEWKAWWEE